MSHFDDLASYRYANCNEPGVLHVGWLGRGHEYAQGSVAPALVEKLKHLAKSPVKLYRGYHICNLCQPPENLRGRPFDAQWGPWMQCRKSNGEIRVSRAGVTYAAPVLITHYIEEHGYLPPAEFLSAIEEWPNKSIQTTAMKHPPSATIPAPLAHF